MNRALCWRAIMICALLISPIQAMGQTPAPQEILDNWANARGGRELIDRVETRAVSAKISLYGMDGTIEQKMAHAGQFKWDLELGGIFNITSLASAGHTWYRDQDGNITETSGKEQMDLLATAYFENMNHLRSDATASLITDVAEASDTGLLAVTMIPPAGTETVYFLDQTTWLPVRAETVAGSGDTLVVDYSDWQSVQGIQFAYRIHQTDGEVQNDMTMLVQDIVVNPQWQTSPFAPLTKAASVSPIIEPNLAAAIPITLRGVHIYVDLMINNQGPFQFIYDTGASMTVVDKSLVESLGIDLQGEMAGGGVGENKIEVALAAGLSLGLPGVLTPDQTVAVVELSQGIEAVIGTRIDGILGYGFISQFVTEIDYANSRIGLYDPATFSYAGDGVVVPMVIDNSTPHIEATVVGHGGEPVTGYFMLDSGSGGAVSMSGPFAARNNIVATMPRTVNDNSGFGVGGSTSAVVGRLQSLQLGTALFENPFITVSQDKGGAGADENEAGLIGGRLLSRCRVFLDYSDGRLILEPSDRIASPFNWNKSGMSISTGGRGNFHHFTIRTIVTGSPAEQAGMMVGDQLLAIGDRAAADWDSHEISELFRGKDQDLDLVLGRDGEKISVKLKLRDII